MMLILRICKRSTGTRMKTLAINTLSSKDLYSSLEETNANLRNEG